MAVKLVTEESEREVTLLKDANIEYVSLVRHGANRMPFRVVKQQKKGGVDKDMNYAIQSIILPQGTELATVAVTKGLEYLSEADTEQRKDYDGYYRLDQMEPENFDSESFKMLKVGNGWLLVGALTTKAKADDALTLSEEQVEKLASLPVAPMNAIIGDPDAAAQMALASSFRELFEQELYAMLDIVHGTLKQAAAEPKKRKAQIIGAIDAFKNFLSMGLDAIGGNAVGKMEKLVVKLETKKTDKGDEVMDFKSDEFKEAVSGILTPLLAEIVTTLKAELKPAADNTDGADDDAAKAKAAADKVISDKAAADKVAADAAASEKGDKDKPSAEVIELRKNVKDLSEKVEKMGDQLEADPGANGSGDQTTDAEKAEAEAKKKAAAETLPPAIETNWSDKKINTDVFSGFLAKKAAKA